MIWGVFPFWVIELNWDEVMAQPTGIQYIIMNPYTENIIYNIDPHTILNHGN